MSRLEMLDGETWASFLQAPMAVLMLGKSDCENCTRWTAELEAFLATDETYQDVRFGKLLLDQRGISAFRKANPWLKDLEHLPYNLIYQGGEKVKEFAGDGVARLTNRLDRLRATSPA